MAEVIVVGSGVAGASCAYALARRGVRVLCVDSAEDGQATAAGAGIVQPWSSSVEDDAWFALYAAGAAHYPTLVQQLADDGVGDLGYRRTGGLVVCADSAALAATEARTRERAARHPGAGEISRVDAAQARGLFPPLAPDLSGLFVAGGAHVDGRRLRDGLLRAAGSRGAERRHGRAELRVDRDRVIGVRLDGQIVRADTVILAAGAWTNHLLAPLGLAVAVQPQRGQIMHLRLDGTDTSGWPSVHPLTGHYLVCFQDSRVVAGATRETGGGFDARVTAGGLRAILTAALEVAPGLARATHVETRVGLRPLADDNRVLIGALPGVEGVLLATGYGAAGLTLGPLTGELVAELVTTGITPAAIAALPPVITGTGGASST